MAYPYTIDERYNGGILQFAAGTLDAPSTIYTTATLAQGVSGYGATIPYLFQADRDTYSLGILDPGRYLISASGYNWDFSNLILGLYTPTVEVHDALGQFVGSNLFGSYTLDVAQAGAYFITVVGQSFNSNEYSVGYTRLVNDTPSGTALVSGSLVVGKTVSADYSIVDVNGIALGAITTQWYESADQISWSAIEGATSESLRISAEQQDKYLGYQLSYYDNDGFFNFFDSAPSAKVEADTTGPRLILSTLDDVTINPEIIAILTFDENIITAGGFVRVSDDSGQVLFNLSTVDSDRIYVLDSRVFINFRDLLEHDRAYKIEFPAALFSDGYGNDILEGITEEVVTTKAPANAMADSQPDAISDDNLLNALTHGYVWELGEQRIINWSLSDGFQGEYWTDRASTIAHVGAALGTIAHYIDVEFNYVGYFLNPEQAYDYGSNINISMSDLGGFFTSENTWARGYFPSVDYDSLIYQGASGDVYLNLSSPANYLRSYAPGSAGWMLMLHEFGHVLGLKHPHDDGGSGRPTFTELGIDKFDVDIASVMSYEDGADWNLIAWDPATPMPLDIYGLQALYGENLTSTSDDRTYKLSETASYSTIWDSAGADAIDLEDVAGGWFLNLPREFVIADTSFSLGFAFPNDEKELATPHTLFWLMGEYEIINGSSGSDTFIGNELNNVLRGEGGDDTIVGGTGNDYLDGGNGYNIIDGGVGDDIYLVDMSAITNQSVSENWIKTEIKDNAGIDLLVFLPAQTEVDYEVSFYRINSGRDIAYCYNYNLGDHGDELLAKYILPDNTYNLDKLVEDGSHYVLLTDQYLLQEDNSYADVIDRIHVGNTVDSEFNLIENFNVGGFYFSEGFIHGTLDDDLIISDGENLSGGAGDDLLSGQFVTTPLSIQGGAGDDVIRGARASSSLEGGNGNDNVGAFSGDDSLSGGAGSDSLDGGTGSDTAFYSGGLSDYTVVLLESGDYRITDQRNSSPDGTDLLSDIEFLVFGNDEPLAIALAIDTTPPTISSVSPLDGARSVTANGNLRFTFSENLQRGTGDIVLRTAAGTTVETYAAGSNAVTISGDTLTIDPTSDLIDGLEYEVIFASGSVEDLSGNQYGGSSDYNFVVGQTQTYNSLAFAKAEALDTRDYRADGEVTAFGVTSPVSGIVFDQEVSTTLFRGDFAYIKTYSETEIQIVDGIENRSSSTFTNYYDTNYVLLATLVGDYITLVEPVEESFYNSDTFTVGDSGVIAKWSTYLVADIGDLTVDFSTPSEATASGYVSYAITQREYEGEILDTFVGRNVTASGVVLEQREILLDETGTVVSRRGSNAGQDYLSTFILTATSNLDVLAPTVTTFSPQDGATDFSPSSDIVVTFSEDISRSNGDIVLKTAAGSTVATYGYGSPEVVVNGNTLTINPLSDLKYATEYVVEFKTGSVIDIAGNENTSVTDYNFTVAPLPDTTAPTVEAFSPADSAQGASVSANLVVTFSEEVTRGSGQIVLKTSGGTTVETYSADSGNVTISGNKLVIDPTLKLDYQTQYLLTLPSGIVEDLAGNSLASAATHNFTTRAEGAGYDVAPRFKYWSKGAGEGSERLLSNVKVAVGDNPSTYSDNTGASLLEGVDDLDDTDDGIITPVVTYDNLADKDDASINLSDVIASLKLFLGLNLPDAYRSPYNYVAADLDANGKVELSDVISLLKVFLGLPVANTQAMEWVFVKDSDSPTDINGQSFDKDHATPPPISHDFSVSAEVNIVGILRGDVDGSWTPPTAT